jgi:hypothetical protein
VTTTRTVVFMGTRPEAVKLAPVVAAVRVSAGSDSPQKRRCETPTKCVARR